MKTTLDIILVNRNSGELIRSCLNSIYLSNRTAFEFGKIIIVDDCSTDASLIGLENYNLPLIVVYNDSRIGYGASCNKGVLKSDGELLLFLNTDIELKNNTLDQAVINYIVLRRTKVGILGVQLRERDGSISRCSSRFPSFGILLNEILYLNKISPNIFKGIRLSDWDHDDSRRVDQVMGAFMLISRDLFDLVEGYSQEFFVYMEDLDLSLKLKKLGYDSYFLATTFATHLGGGTARKFWWESLYLLQQSRIKYSFKHFGIIPGIFISINCLFFGPMIRIVTHVLKGDIFDVRSSIIASCYLFYWVIKTRIQSIGCKLKISD